MHKYVNTISSSTLCCEKSYLDICEQRHETISVHTHIHTCVLERNADFPALFCAVQTENYQVCTGLYFCVYIYMPCDQLGHHVTDCFTWVILDSPVRSTLFTLDMQNSNQVSENSCAEAVSSTFVHHRPRWCGRSREVT